MKFEHSLTHESSNGLRVNAREDTTKLSREHRQNILWHKSMFFLDQSQKQ